MTLTKSAFTAALMATVAMPALAEGQLNLYSSRHYDTDERLYSDFTEQTGITINRIEGKADELLARMEAEGANSPADVLITVDTSRLSRAKEMACCNPLTATSSKSVSPATCKTPTTTGSAFRSARGSSFTARTR